MSNLGKVLLAAAILSITVSLVGHKSAVVDGMGKAFFGVFLIVFFIDRFFGKENPS